jgi:hypothetical protein
MASQQARTARLAVSRGTIRFASPNFIASDGKTNVTRGAG